MYKIAHQKVRIDFSDIAQLKVVPFNLYDSKGNLICKKNQYLHKNLLIYMENIEIYRKAFLNEIVQASNVVTKISRQTADKLVDITKAFINALDKGNKPPIEIVYLVRDVVFNETFKEMKRINHLSEIRIAYDDYALSHSINVSLLSTALGIKLGYNTEALKTLTLGALLHDIGMTRIPDEIVNKPAKLSVEEYDLIKRHPAIGYRIITSEYNMPEAVGKIALEHHERYNGSGYPKGKSGDEIDYFAQIVSLADVYDAASSNKAYAPSKNYRIIARELAKLSKSFNPEILKTLFYMINY